MNPFLRGFADELVKVANGNLVTAVQQQLAGRSIGQLATKSHGPSQRYGGHRKIQISDLHPPKSHPKQTTTRGAREIAEAAGAGARFSTTSIGTVAELSRPGLKKGPGFDRP